MGFENGTYIKGFETMNHDIARLFSKLNEIRANGQVWTDKFEDECKALIKEWALANDRYLDPMFLGGYDSDPYYLARMEINNTLHTLSIWGSEAIEELFEYKLLNFWTHPHHEEHDVIEALKTKVDELQLILYAGR